MKIRELLSDPSKWTKESFAKDCYGRVVPAEKPEAVCWCLWGALRVCYPWGDINDKYNEVLSKLNNEIGNIPKYNDAPERTHEEIMELVNRLDI